MKEEARLAKTVSTHECCMLQRRQRYSTVHFRLHRLQVLPCLADSCTKVKNNYSIAIPPCPSATSAVVPISASRSPIYLHVRCSALRTRFWPTDAASFEEKGPSKMLLDKSSGQRGVKVFFFFQTLHTTRWACSLSSIVILSHRRKWMT